MESKIWSEVWMEREKNSNFLDKLRIFIFGRFYKCLLQKYSHKSSRVLELGCAPGSIYRMLERNNFVGQYHGIDYSQPGLDITEKKYPELKGLLFFGDILSAAEWGADCCSKFDLVFSAGLIEHFRDPTAAIEAHKYFLKDSGVIVITIPMYDFQWLKSYMRLLCPVQYRIHVFESMNLNFLKQKFEEIGLQVVDAGYGCPITFPRIEKFPRVINLSLNALRLLVNVILLIPIVPRKGVIYIVGTNKEG